MKTAVRRRLWALGCSLSLLVCLPLIRPWLDIGIIDDTSYTRSAQLLAQTGHILYNGWAAPILGWHLYWGALFIKLFGFSFNVTRLSTLPVAMAAAFFSQRSMVRTGLTEWNATLATLTLILSPLFLPLTFSYMTDIGGYFVIVLCFYACLRALQAEGDGTACWWIAFAAISNGVGGTIRQISWLGLLVIVPAALWLLRGRRKVVLCGLFAMILGLVIMAGAMEWYKHQPMALPEPLWRGSLTQDRVRNIVRGMSRFLFDAPLFLLPVLLLFLPKVRWKDRYDWVAFIGASSFIIAALLLIQPLPRVAWLEPVIGNYVTEHGVIDGSFINGSRPVILTDPIRAVLTVLVIAGLASLTAVLLRKPVSNRQELDDVISWNALFLLVGPFLAVSLALIVSRASIDMVFDRYLIPLLFFALLLLVRYYQQQVSRQLPRYSVLLLSVVALYGVGATHDTFVMLRARMNAVHELEARGVPDAQIDGGWEFNTWAILNRSADLRIDEKTKSQFSTAVAENPEVICKPEFSEKLRTGFPKYALSYDPDECGGPVGIPAVPYHEWFGPRNTSIYVVSAWKPPVAPAEAATR
jgi:hypothetical protein